MVRRNLAASLAILMFAPACSSKPQQPEATIVVPSAATSAPRYRGDGQIPEQRYVVRMSDGERDWEVEFPEVATGYEMRIPLKGEEKPSRKEALRWESEELTEADKQLLDQLRRMNPEMEREGVYVEGRNINDPEGKNEVGGLEPGGELDEEGKTVADPGEVSPQGKSEADAAPTRPSYLLGLQEIQKLYRSGNYELAMVRLVQLERSYPGDPKLLSMKGSLWMKLGQEELAREAWEQVLQMDPNNKAVIQALERLD